MIFNENWMILRRASFGDVSVELRPRVGPILPNLLTLIVFFSWITLVECSLLQQKDVIVPSAAAE